MFTTHYKAMRSYITEAFLLYQVRFSFIEFGYLSILRLSYGKLFFFFINKIWLWKAFLILILLSYRSLFLATPLLHKPGEHKHSVSVLAFQRYVPVFAALAISKQPCAAAQRAVFTTWVWRNPAAGAGWEVSSWGGQLLQLRARVVSARLTVTW